MHFSELKLKILVSGDKLEPPGAALFCLEAEPLFLPGARVGSGTSDVGSKSHPKKWQLGNTVIRSLNLLKQKKVGTGSGF